MWNRKELKQKARQIVKKNYWTVLIVCFILALVTSEFGMSTTILERNDEPFTFYTYEYQDNLKNTSEFAATTINEQVNSATKSFKYIQKINDAVIYFANESLVYGVALCIGAVAGMAFILLIAQPLIVGGRRFFIKIREDSKTKVLTILSVFRKGQWSNVVKVMFLRNFFTILWFLTIIGGFIKIYQYRMIPFLIADNPNIKYKEAFSLSKQMMKGNKWKAFVLDLSFIGWDILSICTLGLVSVLYLNPYMATTNTELYLYLKEVAIKEKFENYKLLEEIKEN